jgi:chitodextrinase
MAQTTLALTPRASRWVAIATLVSLCACSGDPASSLPSPRPEATRAPAVAAPPEVAPDTTPARLPAPDPAPVAKAPGLPSAPSQLRATAQSASEIALAWQPSASGPGAVAYEVFRDEAQTGSRLAGTTLVDPSLRPGRRYCYAVRAVDAAGRASARSAPACAQTLDTTAPSTPSGLTAAARPGNVAELSWNPSTDDVGVTAYEVAHADAPTTIVKGTTLRAEKLAPGREHCWTVKALDAAGNRSAGSDPACAAIPDTTPPTVPTRVTATAAGERSADVQWEASRDDVGVARYEIQRAGAPILAAADTSARDRGLSPARRYCYAVRACDAAGNCSAPAPEACATTPDLTPPTRPATLEARPRGDRTLELAWASATDEVGVTGYELRRGEKVVASGEAGLSFTDGGLRPGTEYCYTVLAFDAAGNRSPTTRACATTPDLEPPSAPGRPAAVSVSSSQLFLGWDPSTDDVGVAGYEVLRDGAVVARVAVTRAREARLPANRKFCYGVRAFDAAGNRSQPAGPACATTADPSQLASPSDLRVVRVSTTDVLLQWEPSEQAGVLYRIYANGTKSVGLTRGNTFNPSGRIGAQADCYRVAALDDEGRESPRSNEVCALLAPGPVSQR